MKKYYLGYNGQRISVALTRDEAILLLFTTRAAIKGLSIMVYDERDRLIRIIPGKKK